METILTDENFEKEITATDKLVLVDFFAVWCDPCSMLAPILEKIAEQFKKEVVLMKVNLDNAPATAQKFGVEKIPTVILFKNGHPISGFVGLATEESIKEWLEKIIKNDGKAESPAATDDKQKKIEEQAKEYAEYAKKNGFQLNPDKKTAERVINGLLENEKKYGEKYCPCRRVTGNKEEDTKKICPCFWHKDEINKDGHCLCRLYTR